MSGEAGRLAGKVAIVVGAGQTPGDTIGNGRATAILFAREGARVWAVDRDLTSAQETVDSILAEGGEAKAFAADATDEEDCRALAAGCVEAFGRIDILHNNVGIGGRDASTTRIEEEVWDRIMAVNVKSVVLPSKHVLPVMREQGSGVITNVSSIAAVCATPMVAYRTSKAAVNAYTQSLATANARHGIRANAIMPGLMNTPMAIEGQSHLRGLSKQDLIEARDAQVPLGKKMGTAWDVAHAALFLASDEASFISGAILPVDGAQSLRAG